MERHFVLCKLLVQEAVKLSVNNTEEWNELFNSTVLNVVTVGIHRVPLMTKLAIAVTVVGSMNTVFFPLAFKLMSDWEKMGGCYWVIQEELLRHSALVCIRHGFQHELSGDFNTPAVTKELADIVPKDCPEFVNNVVLRQRMTVLHKELTDLLCCITESSAPWSVYVEYASQFPLKQFSVWFLQWAQPLLKSCVVASAGCLRSGSDISSEELPKVASDSIVRYMPPRKIDDILDTHRAKRGHSAGKRALLASSGHLCTENSESTLPMNESQGQCSTEADDKGLQHTTWSAMAHSHSVRVTPAQHPPDRTGGASGSTGDSNTDYCLQDRIVFASCDVPSSSVGKPHKNAAVAVAGKEDAGSTAVSAAQIMASVGSGLWTMFSPPTHYTTSLTTESSQ